MLEWGGPSSNMIGVLIQRRNRPVKTDTQGECHGRWRRRLGSCNCPSRGAKDCRHHQKVRELRKDSARGLRGRAAPTTPRFQALASKASSGHIPLVLSRLVCFMLIQQTREMNPGFAEHLHAAWQTVTPVDR